MAPDAPTQPMVWPHRGSGRSGKLPPAQGRWWPGSWGSRLPKGVMGGSRLRAEPLGSSGGAEGDRKEVIRRPCGCLLPVPNAVLKARLCPRPQKPFPLRPLAVPPHSPPKPTLPSAASLHITASLPTHPAPVFPRCSLLTCLSLSGVTLVLQVSGS